MSKEYRDTYIGKQLFIRFVVAFMIGIIPLTEVIADLIENTISYNDIIYAIFASLFFLIALILNLTYIKYLIKYIESK